MVPEATGKYVLLFRGNVPPVFSKRCSQPRCRLRSLICVRLTASKDSSPAPFERKSFMGNMKRSRIRSLRDDCVVVALKPFLYERELFEQKTALVDNISADRKAAARLVPAGSPSFQYGQIAEFACTDIEPDSHPCCHFRVCACRPCAADLLKLVPARQLCRDDGFVRSYSH